MSDTVIKAALLLTLVVMLSGCADKSSPPDQTSESVAPSSTADDATSNKGLTKPDSRSTDSAKKSPARRPLAATRVGLNTRAIAEHRHRLQDLLAKAKPLLSSVDEDATATDMVQAELRKWTEDAFPVALAVPLPTADSLPSGRRTLLLALCASNSGSALPDASQLLSQASAALTDYDEAGVALLLLLRSLPYQAEQRDDYFLALRSLLETAPHQKVRLLAHAHLTEAGQSLEATYLAGLRESKDGGHFNGAASAVAGRQLASLGSVDVIRAISTLFEWKLGLQSELEHFQRQDAAYDRQKRSSYASRSQANADLVREVREAGELPRTQTLEYEIRCIDDAVEQLRLARRGHISAMAQKLGLTPMHSDASLTENERYAQLAIEIGRSYLVRGNSAVAMEEFLEASTLVSGEKVNCRLFGLASCGSIVALRRVQNYSEMGQHATDTCKYLLDASVKDEEFRMPAVAAVELALGDALAERGRSKEATAIFEEVDGVLRELPLDAALEPHLIIAELWCEAGLYSMAQRSLDKVSPAIEKVAERDPRRAARALCHFGEVCLSQSRFDEATACFDRARALARTKELSDVLIEANARLALAQAEAGDTQNANESLRTATHAQGIEDVSLTTLALMDLVQGELLLQQKAMDEAAEYLQSAHFAFWQERGPASYLTSRCQALLDKLAAALEQNSAQ